MCTTCMYDCRQNEERKSLLTKHAQEIKLHKLEQKASLYQLLCKSCAMRHANTNSRTAMCDVHQVSEILQEQHQTWTAVGDGQSPQTICSQSFVNYSSSPLADEGQVPSSRHVRQLQDDLQVSCKRS